MNSKILMGILLIILSIILFIFGVHVFTYRGESTALFRNIGAISFIGWFPILIIAIIFVFIGFSEGSKNKNDSL